MPSQPFSAASGVESNEMPQDPATLVTASVLLLAAATLAALLPARQAA